MEKIIDSVKIIHDELHGGEYRFLSDFFRLIGSHVCDCTLKKEFRQTSFDAVIIINNYLEESAQNKLKENYPKAFFADPLDLKESSDIEKTNYLIDCLQNIFAYSESSDMVQAQKELEALEKIAGVFVKHQLLEARNTFAYFYHERDVVQKAQNQYVNALLKLSEDEELSKDESKYYIYAKVDIARFVNETCSFLKQELLFDTNRLMEELDKALIIDPNFANVYVLKGFLAEIDAQFRMGSDSYYQRAIKIIGDQPYTSYLYYRLGRYYEKVEEDWDKAKIYYEKSNVVNPEEYRTIYKIMLLEKREGHYREATEACKTIRNILYWKLHHNYLQQKEYEYLIKSYHSEGILFGKYLNDSTRASNAFRCRNEICDKILEKNEMYEQIYGVNAKRYQELTYRIFKAKING